MPFLITGCGRSGTKYTAKVFQACGLDVQHERPGMDGVVSSIWAVEDLQYPGYHYQGLRPSFDLVLHQVREPLSTIGSLTTALQGSWIWNARHIPIDPNEHSIVKAAQYWYYWNLKCEEIAGYRYQVEQLEEEWSTVCAMVGIKPTPEFPEISKETNSREHIRLNWVQLGACIKEPVYGDIRDMAERYGYE